MNTQLKSRRDVVAEHIYALVKTRARRKGCRVRKLQDTSARDSVINGAAWRLVQVYAVFGNIRDYIEGDFWHEDGDARNKLIDRALDTERKAYIRALKQLDPEAQAKYVEATGIRFTLGPLLQPLVANSVTDVIEQEEQSEDDAAADDARERIEAEENERLREARNAYGETLRLAHRRALWLISSEPTLTNSAIAAKVGMRSVRGIKPETVARIRDKLTELANGILTRSHEDVYLEELERSAAVKEAADAVRRAERQLHRAQWRLSKSAEELAAFRAFAEPLCDALGMSVDELLGASIAPKPG
jgi:hypothetical protein